MAEANKRTAQRFFDEVFSQGTLEGLDDLVAPDYVNHDAPPGTPPGPQGVRPLIAAYRTAFPDLHFTIEDQVAEGDLVATRWTATGTHQGDLLGIAPTGRAVRTTGISIVRLAEGRLQEAWVSWELAGLMQQLGVAAEPGGATA